jgi:hypothetical protein
VRRVRGVVEARVVRDEHGAGEVCVISVPTRSQSLVIRDVETALMNCVDDISCWTVNVVQIDENLLSYIRTPRARLLGVGSSVDGLIEESHVKLEYCGKVSEGRAHTVATRESLWRSMAEAVVKALSGYLPAPGITFRVEDIKRVRLGRTEVVIVCLLCSCPGEGWILSGSCPVGCDLREAVAKATLDAANRQFIRLTQW